LHSERIAATPSRLRLFATLALASAPLLLTACGSNYRPVISSVSPVGPAGQPTKYAVAISAPTPTSPGLVNIVDFSGDTILVTAAIGVNPQYLVLQNGGSPGYTLNGDGTVNSFAVTVSLLQSQVYQTTLPLGAAPTTITSSSFLYITQSGLNNVAELAGGTPPAIGQQLPTGPGTTYVVAAPAGTPRAYALVQNGASNGQADAIETSTNTLSNVIPVGVDPVYGVMTADDRRAFIMNKGSNTVTVINAQANALDTPSLAPAGTIAVGTAPVWADFAPTLNEMLVANQGDGIHAGSVSIVNIALCNATTVTSNPACDVNNPVDAVGFGQVLATVPVCVNPQQIAVLQDGSQAFVSCAGNAAAGIAGAVSVINLVNQTVVATIPAVAGDTDPADTYIHGHPNFIAVTTGTPTGKAYITSPDSNDLTIIRTDTDAVIAHLSLQGAGVMVRTSAP
jgi:DNA-binding beta-propeller fold protein YncE